MQTEKTEVCTYNEIDGAVLKWITMIQKKYLALLGMLIKEMSLQFAEALGHSYRPSTDEFKKCPNIVKKK